MSTDQRRRRRSIRTASAITGFLFIMITLICPALAGMITQ